jgi:hypothetical protein
MRRTLLTILVVCAALAAIPALGVAAGTQTYKGKAKSVAGDFQYGPVTVKRKGSRVLRVKIEAVTATCPFGTTNRTIVFNPKDSAIKIVSGSNRIKSGKMSVVFLPDETVEDQRTTLKLTFKGARVTGRFSETDICVDEGKFTARR